MQLIYITRSFCPDRCPTSEQTTFITNTTAASAGTSANANGSSNNTGSATAGTIAGTSTPVVIKKLHAKDKVLSITDGCIEDMSSMLQTAVIPNLCAIVGHDIDGRKLVPRNKLIQTGNNDDHEEVEGDGEELLPLHDQLVTQVCDIPPCHV